MTCKYPHCALERPLMSYEQRDGYHIPCANRKHAADHYERNQLIMTDKPAATLSKQAEYAATTTANTAGRRSK